MENTNNQLEMAKKTAHQKLAVNREYFHNEWGPLILGAEIAGVITELEPNFYEKNYMRPYNHAQAMTEVLRREQKREMDIVYESLSLHMARLGVSAHKGDIVSGLNKSMRRVQLWDDSQHAHLLQLRAIMHHDTTALVDFGLEYVEKWKMYHELFGGEK